MFPTIHKLIKQTAKDLNMDPVLTEKVVMSQFLFLKNAFADPKRPVIRLEDLGKFSINPSSIRTHFKIVREKLVTNPTSRVYQKALRDIARMRYITQVYYLSRKYKLRFGSWHYKAVNINNNVE